MPSSQPTNKITNPRESLLILIDGTTYATVNVKLYGLEGDMAPDRKYTSRLAIVALSAQPPGVNKLFVCNQKPGEGLSRILT